MMLRRIFLLLGLCCALPCAHAHVPALEREVNLVLNNTPAGTVLKKIEEQTGLVFSYASQVLNNVAPLSATLRRKSVREVLVLLLPPNISYKAKNNYIILKERRDEKPAKKKEVSGYVVDGTTEKKLANVSVYDKATLQSATTDAYGFYKLSVPAAQQTIAVNRLHYEDTVVTLPGAQQNRLVNIALQAVSDSLRRHDSLNWRGRLRDLGNYTQQLFKNFKGYVNELNIRDTLVCPLQVALLPYIGTNHRLSGSIINRVSFNVFGGYARGVQGFEAGGFFNVDRENVDGVQLAGFFNLVGDSVRGTQAAGFFNVTGRAVQGVQAGGFFNSNLGTLDGLSAAGFFNVNRKRVNGVQLAGFFNLAADSLEGLQGAGFMNIGRNVKGLALAGFMNLARNADGLQAAGFLNVADTARAVQVAGFLNRARVVEGTQVAGFINSSKTLRGYQVGVLNFTDSCKGVPIGVLSFVRKGLHQLEVSGDEVFATNLAFRTGVPVFYTVLSAGLDPFSSAPVWSFGYAIGTSFRMTDRWRSDLSLGTQHVNFGSFTDSNSDLYKLYWGVEYKIARKITVAAGPSLNLFLRDTQAPDYNATPLAPYTVVSTTFANGLQLSGWVGGKLAFRFF